MITMVMTLKQWRRGWELSQREMANKLGVHENTYRSWERSPGKIPIQYVVKITEILDIPMQDFLGFIGKEGK